MTDIIITAAKVKELIDSGTRVQLIDTRPAIDFGVVHIEGAVSIPYSELYQRLDMIERNSIVVVLCKFGIKVMGEISQLRSLLNKEDIYCMKDGLIGWAIEADDDFPRDLL